MKTALLTLCSAALLLTLALPAHAQPSDSGDTPEVIYLIFDGSGSMWGELPDKSRKVTVAKEVLQDFVAGDFEGYELALRAYGHRRKGDCRDSELVVPFGAPEEAVGQVRAFMKDLNPLGKTPISYSLRQALDDFGARSGEIILISDGIETCDDDPCALVRAWREKDIPIRVHVVGLGLEEKAKVAMQCIADAAGTEYRDADDAATLAEGLRTIQEEAESGEPPPRVVSTVLYLTGVDASGNAVRVEGQLRQGDQGRFEVSSNRRNVVESGEYALVVGVPTKDGTLYEPVTQPVSVAADDVTQVTVEVPLPPRVYAVFMEGEERQGGSLVRAFQDGKEAFSFRARDTVFVQPGTYEFRAAPNADNELSVTEEVAPGALQEVLFQMIQTVHATFTLRPFVNNVELWQGEERRYKIHARNGGQVQPGTYELRMPDYLAPYHHGEITITSEDPQVFEIDLPVGHATFKYQHADGSPADDARVFVRRLGPPPVSTKSSNYRRGGEAHPLLPGRYEVSGWRQKGSFDPVTFEIAAGEEKTITLRARE